MQKCLEQIADVVDPKPSDDASTMVKLNWADHRRHMQAMLVEQVKNVVADRNRSLYQFAGAIKGGWREAVASTLDELVKALPDDRRTYRGVRSRAERLASELRGPDRRAVLVTVDRQDVTMEWVSLLHEALRRSGVYPIPSLETFTLDEARKLVTFVRLAPGVGAGAQSGETSDGGGL